MKKERLIILGIILLLAINKGITQSLAVSSRGEHLVTFIDLSSGKEITKIKTGKSPHEIVLSKNKKFLFTASYFENIVSKIDVENLALISDFNLGDNHSLHGIIISPDGGTLWVTSEEKRAIVELETINGKVIKEWPTKSYKSHMIIASLDNSKLYISNIDDGTLSIVNRKEEVTNVIKIGSGSEGLDISKNGKEVWISNRADNTISIVKTDTNKITHTFSSEGSFPVKLKFRPDGEQVWVSNNISRSVAVFDASSKKLITSIIIDKGRPLGITFSDDSKKAYISNPGTDEVIEIITQDFSILRKFNVASSPDGMAYINN